MLLLFLTQIFELNILMQDFQNGFRIIFMTSFPKIIDYILLPYFSESVGMEFRFTADILYFQNVVK